ncbi:MAG: hypothetical protein ACHQU1_00905 [Gemmatimonadales bacterium]
MRTRFRPFFVVVGLLACAAAAPALAQQGPREGSPAAMTSLVLVPTTDLQMINTTLGLKAFIDLGARVDWVPRAPIVANIGLGREIAGHTGTSLFEIGGGWRFKDNIHRSAELVVTGTELVHHGDSVRTYYAGADASVHSYSVLRGGLMTQSVQDGPASAAAVHVSAVYVGISRNTLVNESSGLMGLRVIRTLAVDLLVGSPDSSALSTRKVGARALWTTDWGNVFGTKVEVGSRPGRGFYGLFAVDWYLMFQNVLR